MGAGHVRLCALALIILRDGVEGEKKMDSTEHAIRCGLRKYRGGFIEQLVVITVHAFGDLFEDVSGYRMGLPILLEAFDSWTKICYERPFWVDDVAE